ncbi:hypothetical protein GCM10027022_18240 [Alpinimonas psychrophila]|uniref:Uncharacterized protein n=1 Tax=Alpinimonas psychrophila TaxID=748908 RepID=A0A7W3JU62_9MICO|nr:DUF6049 family protein [Alpinimonas psychrophila]MBA8829314.1 hypothetical protein [Alpinimonas psychrophila]
MLAAPVRRARRMFVRLTVVAVLGAGFSLAPSAALVPSAIAVENASGEVSVSIFPTSGAPVSDSQEVAVTVSLVNDSQKATAAGQVVVTTGSDLLGDAVALNDWLAKSDGKKKPGQWLGVLNAPALAVGAHAVITARLPLTNAYYGSSWGPRGLAADLEVGGTSAGTGRGVLIWATPGAPPAAHLVTLLPVISPPSASGLLSSEELSVLTSAEGLLTSQLALATGRNVTLAVDPRIIASIDALGEKAPAAAQSWLARLAALPNESFALAYADADIALQAQAGATALATPGFADQPQLVVPATPSPTASPVPDASANPNASPSVPTAVWSPMLTGIAWPAENSIVATDLSVIAPVRTQFLVLSSSNVAAGANSPALTSVGSQRTLITNFELSRALQATGSAVDDVHWMANVSLASAYLATTALNPNTQGDAIAALSRESLGDVSDARIGEALDRLNDLSWVDGGTLGKVISSASAPSTTVVDQPESEARVTIAQRLLENRDALARFSSVVETPALVTDASTRQELALFSVAWTSSKSWPLAVDAHLAQTSKTLSSIRVVPSSEIQMVGGQVNIPITIENTLTVPVTIVVHATPSNGRISVDSDATITVQGEAQAKALVPVKARLSNGSVVLSVSLISPTGVPIGSSVTLPVNVRADWESWGLGGLGVLFAALLIAGVVRTVRKRHDASAADALAADVRAGTHADVRG